MSDLEKIKKEFENRADPERAKLLQRFFKTGKGQYGEGDVFLGITVPEQRLIAKKYHDLSLAQIQKLLNSRIHEHRFTALIILVSKFKKAQEIEKEKIYRFYLKNAKKINNWDLVDTSAPHIVGEFLVSRGKKVLYKLARSSNLWEKRIAILATSAFIRNGNFTETLKVAEILLSDKHGLIHKAVGWMLREVGKKSLKAEEKFLQQHYKAMPRVALRYAIEKFARAKQIRYLRIAKSAKLP